MNISAPRRDDLRLPESKAMDDAEIAGVFNPRNGWRAIRSVAMHSYSSEVEAAYYLLEENVGLLSPRVQRSNGQHALFRRTGRQ